MDLTQEQLEKFINTSKLNPVCPNCGSDTKPSLQPTEYQLISYKRIEGSLEPDGPIAFMPLAGIVCQDCGFVRLFNLKILGVS